MLSAESSLSEPVPTMTKEDADYTAERAAAQIIDELGLIGTPKDCMEKISAWESIGVDEVACLIDCGIPVPETLEQMHNLATLARQ
jgi:alkanesulfonate monooxygenase SsuD/methylene tetrahydromethanopterin reductase-like flavin-dependent oxidoreductase (luciferase family)